MVSEPRARDRNVLRGDGRLQFGQAGAHYLANVFARNRDRNQCRELWLGLNDTKWFDHGYSPNFEDWLNRASLLISASWFSARHMFSG